MENFRRNIQTKEKTNLQGRCGILNSGYPTGMLLGRQRYKNLGRNKLGQNRLEWGTC